MEGRELVGTRIMGFEEAMIIEAIAMVIFGGSLPLSLCVFVFVLLFWLNGELSELSDLSREREGGFGNGGGLSEFFATQFQRLE